MGRKNLGHGAGRTEGEGSFLLSVGGEFSLVGVVARDGVRQTSEVAGEASSRAGIGGVSREVLGAS